MAGAKCMRCGVRVGWVGLIVDAALVALKLSVGFRTGSRAVMADALYSIIDMISAILVIAAFKLSRKGPNGRYPYGHGKVEFLAIGAVALCVGFFAFVLLHRAVDALAQGDHQPVEPLAAAATAVGIGCCFMLWRYARCVGERLNSPVIITHAEHNKADTVSSVAVLVSIALSWVGLGWLDPLVAVVEIVHVLTISVSLLRMGLDGLLDASVDSHRTARLAHIAAGVPGVMGIGSVRARNVGSQVWVELSVTVAPKRRMADVGRIRSMVRSEVLRRVDHVANVMVEVLPALSIDAAEDTTVALQSAAWKET